jgi:hypothetical protein
MSLQQAKELLPIITAFGEGKQIQWRHKPTAQNPNDDWRDDSTSNLQLLEHLEYRIKPQPREFWVNEYVGVNINESVFSIQNKKL